MSRSKYLQRVVHLSLAAATFSLAIPAYAQQAAPEKSTSTLGAVIVTAQKKEESIQDVPIAVTALSADELTARGLDGGPQILQAVPNVSFSKANFTGYNLQIRGVGSKLIAASGDQGVGIHHNNVPLAASRFFEAEFFDMERIEVLRGPQGTLYGRNATGGVFNAITAKPVNKFEAAVTLDYGNYDSLKLKGMVNLPISDDVQLRLAGISLSRDGYLQNTASNTDVDGRDLFSTRATLAINNGDGFKGYFLWEHFEEDDDRQRTGAQLCTKDTGPATVGGQATNITDPNGRQARWFLSQGCLPGSLYSDAALGTINSNGSLGGVFSNLLGLYPGDVYANQRISSDLRTTGSYYLPKYQAESDIIEINLEFAVAEDLLLTSLTSYNEDSVNSQQDYNRAVPNGKFLNTFFTPGGFFNDPQTGSTNTIAVHDKSFINSITWTEELRLQSSFDGWFNFNVGGIYLEQNSPNQGYYVFFNTGTVYSTCVNAGFCGAPPPVPIYIDPNVEPNGEGHNYYFNKQTFSLRSMAGFGEAYFQVHDDVKITAGARYTKDKKAADTYDFNKQFIYPGRGFSADSIKHQADTFAEWTGRAGVDWKITPDMMLYGFISRGYKGGGFNSATGGTVADNFEPEIVDALEVGIKNTFMDGRIQANGTVFAYDYQGYQISRIVNLSSVNDNIDAKIYGAEFELVFNPLEGMRIDANIGYLNTEIKASEASLSVDVMNRTQGDPSLSVIKGFSGTNCVAPTAQLAQVINFLNLGALGPNHALAIPAICDGGVLGIIPTDGTPIETAGNELPNSPEFTFSVGIQQTFNFGGGWSTTVRGDYYQQTDSYARIYNTEFDRIEGWSNVNVSWSVDNSDMGLSILAYAKNLLDEDNITDVYLTDDSSGLFANSFLSDPQLIGLSVTKKF
jgi:outer membrane receptor protein involved in Fe transport